MQQFTGTIKISRKKTGTQTTTKRCSAALTSLESDGKRGAVPPDTVSIRNEAWSWDRDNRH
jgi:hypothetical protein